MTRIIYVVYTREYLTSWQIISANLKKYAFLCDYSEVKTDDLIDSPMYSTPMQVVSISPCESLADTVVNGIPLKRIIISTINNIKVGQLNNNQNSSKMERNLYSAALLRNTNHSLFLKRTTHWKYPWTEISVCPWIVSM